VQGMTRFQPLKIQKRESFFIKLNDNNMKQITNLIIIFLISFNSIAQNKYENLVYRFTIDFPANWTIKNSTQKYTLIKAVKTTETCISYIAIAAYPIPKEDSDFYKSASTKDMFKIFSEEYPSNKIELINSGIITLDGERTIWTNVKFFIDNTKYLIMNNYHLLHEGTFFRITTSTDGGEKQYNELKSIFENSVSTIHFND